MARFVDELHVEGALIAHADPAKVTQTLIAAEGQTEPVARFLAADAAAVIFEVGVDGTVLAPSFRQGGQQVATESFVASQVAALVGSAPDVLDTLGEIATQLQADQGNASGLLATLGTKAPLASPTLTGTTTVTDLVVGGTITVPDASIPVAKVSGLGSALASFETLVGSQAKADAARIAAISAAAADATSKANAAQAAAVATVLGGAGAAYDTLAEIQALLTSDESTAAALATLVGTKAPLIGPTFTPSATNAVGVVVKGLASQSANLQEWQDSTGGALAKVDATGAAYFSPVPGIPARSIAIKASTAAPTAEGALVAANRLWIEASASIYTVNNGAAAVPVLITRGVASQSADLQQWQNSAGSVLGSINSVGAFGGRAVTVTATGTTDTNIFAQGFASQSTTLTAFKAGASATGDLMQFLASNSAVRLRVNFDGSIVGSNAASHALGSSTQIANNTLAVYATGTAGVPLIVKGVASQAANLQEWQDSANAVLLRVSPGGVLQAPVASVGVGQAFIGSTTANSPVFHARAYGNSSDGTGAILRLQNENIGASVTQIALGGAIGALITPGATGSAGLVVKGLASQTGDLQQWQDSTGTVLAKIGTGGYFAADMGLRARPDSAPSVGLTVKGQAAQAGDLQQWQNSAASVFAKVDSNGVITANGYITSGAGAFGGGNFGGTTTSISTGATGVIGAIIRGVAGQSASLTEWQNNAGTVLASVNGGGTLTLQTGAYIKGSSTSQNSVLYVENSAAVPPTFLNTADKVGLVIKGFATQSADLQQWQSSAGAILSKVDAAGRFIGGGGTQPTPNARTVAQLSNTSTSGSYLSISSETGQAGFWLQKPSIGEGSGWQIRYDASKGTNPIEFLWSGTTTLAMQGNGLTTFYGGNPAGAPLTVKAAVSQSANMQEWQDSSNTVLARVQADGTVGGVFLSSGNRVTAGTGIFGGSTTEALSALSCFGLRSYSTTLPTLLVKATASQTADYQQWQDSTGLIRARVSSGGQIGIEPTTLATATPTDASSAQLALGTAYWNGTASTNEYGYIQASRQGGTPTTAGQFRLAFSHTTNPDNAGLALMMDGSKTATIGFGFGSPSDGQLFVNTTLATRVGLKVRGTPAQSADIQQWTDSANAVQALMRAGGKMAHKNLLLHLGGTYTDPGDRFAMQITGNYPATFTNTTSYGVQLAVTNIASQATSHGFWSRPIADGAGVLVGTGYGYYSEAPLTSNGAAFTATYGFSNSGGYTYAAWLRGQTVLEGWATAVPVAIVKGQAGQTADLIQWQDSASNVIGKIGSDGSTRIATALPGITPLVVKAAATQTADLLQWQDSSSSVLALITATGRAQFTNVTAGLSGVTSRFGDATAATISGAAVGISPNSGASTIPLVVKGAASQSANMQEWQDNSGTVLSSITAFGHLYTLAQRVGVNSNYGAQINATSTSVSSPVAIFRGAVSQSADLQQWQNSGGSVLMSVSPFGALVGPNSAIQFAIGTFKSNSPANVPMTMQGAASQSGNLTEWRNSANVILAKVRPNGEHESTVPAVAASDAGGGAGGMVLTSPNGTRYRVTVSDAGALTTTAA